jgi:hypothetical protein
LRPDTAKVTEIKRLVEKHEAQLDDWLGESP